MQKLVRIVLAVGCAVALLCQATAQSPDRKAAEGPGREKAKDLSNSPIVIRMMAFDKNKDGKLTRDEVTDVRLHRLFDLADANKDGVVTKDELMALAAKLEAEFGADDDRGGPGGPGRRGPGGPGGPCGPGGRGPGGFGGPPQPGQIMPPFVQERLNLTADQKKQLADLQKEVDGKLAKILTDEQKKQLQEMQRGFGRGGRGPGGPGGPGGRGPRGGPGGSDGRPRPEDQQRPPE
jgi:hypothetical protein